MVKDNNNEKKVEIDERHLIFNMQIYRTFSKKKIIFVKATIKWIPDEYRQRKRGDLSEKLIKLY